MNSWQNIIFLTLIFAGQLDYIDQLYPLFAEVIAAALSERPDWSWISLRQSIRPWRFMPSLDLNSKIMLERHLTVAQFADLVGLHPETVRAAIRRGDIPATRISERGRWLIPESRMRAALLSNEDRQRRRRVSRSSSRRWGAAWRPARRRGSLLPRVASRP